MSAQYPRVLAEFTSRPWACRRETLDTIAAVLSARASGSSATKEEIQAALGVRQARQARKDAQSSSVSSGSVAVVPVFGILTQRASLMSEYSGGTSVADVIAEVRAAMANPSVSGVLLWFDSPGGSCFGIPEGFTALRSLRGTKPLIALCDPMACSAAYWLACACDAIYCTPSGEAGSVGVYLAHEDVSRMNDALGVTVTYIASDPKKVEGNPDEPLSPDARSYLQQQVNDTYAMFVRDVATGRGVSTQKVRDQFGGGRSLLAQDALRAGMIDGIRTFDETIPLLSGAASKRRTADADAARVRLSAMHMAMALSGTPVPEDDATATARLHDQMAEQARRMERARAR